MKRFAVLIPSILLAGVLLSACGMFTLTDQRMQVSLSPSGTLGYNSDGGTITIEERFMTFRNAAGAAGLQLTAYNIKYYDADGNEIAPSSADASGSMSVFVSPGIRCDEPDDDLGCTMLDEGAYVAPGYEVTTANGYQLLDVGVAQRHLDTMAATGLADIHWYAEIQFTGFALDTGAEFVSQPYQVKIAPPN